MNHHERRIKQKEILRADIKPAYQLPKPSDIFINARKMADPDSFPNVRKLLTRGCISQTGSTETDVQLQVYDRGVGKIPQV